MIRWERLSFARLDWEVFTIKKAQRGLEKSERKRVEVCRPKKGEVGEHLAATRGNAAVVET